MEGGRREGEREGERERGREGERKKRKYVVVDLSLQNVGLALRDLLSKVDEVLQDLPQQTHQEVGRKRWSGVVRKEREKRVCGRMWRENRKR